MAKKIATAPRGFRSVTPSLVVSDIDQAIDFYTAAFGAEVVGRDKCEPSGFATIKLGNAMVFLTLGWLGHGQAATVPAPVSLHLYHEDADGQYAAALNAGAQTIASAENRYWGERTAVVQDPFGHVWTIAQRLEVLDADEIEARRLALLNLEATNDAPLS